MLLYNVENLFVFHPKCQHQKGSSQDMIEFKNVYKTYPNVFTALKNVNLQIEQG